MIISIPRQTELPRNARERLDTVKKASYKARGRAVGILLRIAVVFLCILLIGVIAVIGISEYVRASTIKRIYTNALSIEGADGIDCIVVLGAGLKADGTPSHMLEDRIKVGVEVMKETGIEYILMSGDKSGKYYDEPAAMKKYAESLGVDPERILVDEKGFSTYESMTRVKSEYGFERVVIITQKYHLHRALYISARSGIDAVGVSADLRGYRNQTFREIREIVARVKDFLMCI